jgi:hypothetical protein
MADGAGQAVSVGLAKQVVRVGRRPRGRFVVLPAGNEWYSAEQAIDSELISATVVDSDATPRRDEHPELPYEIMIVEN